MAHLLPRRGRVARTRIPKGMQTQHLLPRRGRVARTRIPSFPEGDARTCTKIGPHKSKICFPSPSGNGCTYVHHVPFVEEGESFPKGCAYAQHVPFGEEGVARTRAPSVRARFVRNKASVWLQIGHPLRGKNLSHLAPLVLHVRAQVRTYLASAQICRAHVQIFFQSGALDL